MLAENQHASLDGQLVVPGANRCIQGYYRSKLFVVPSTSNPLLAAAAPLFSVMERLGSSHSLPPVAEMRNSIEHELNAFHSKMTQLDYTEDTLIISNYLLSASIDELLGKNYLRLYETPAEFKAFTPSSHDETGPEKRFFDITHYLKERTNQYLDLIELVYYCLIAGFEGQCHLKTDGRQTLDNLIEELFQLIQQHRVTKPRLLFKDEPSAPPKPSNHKPVIAATLLATAVLGSIYYVSHLVLEQKAKSVLQGYTILAQLNH